MKLSERIIWIVALLLLVGIAVAIVSNYAREAELYKLQVNAVQLENVQYRNKHNELVSEKLAFTGEKKDLKAQLEVWKNDENTIRTKLTGATKELFLLKRVIEINGKGNVITFTNDTQYVIDPTVIDTPILAVDTTDRFHSFKFAGNMKKYAYQVTVLDTSELVVDDLGRRGSLVRLINHNPYVISSKVQSLIVAPKKTPVWKKVFWVGLGAGLSYSLIKF